MVASQQITPGTVISIDNKLYRVETSVKVTVKKGAPFIKTKLRDLNSNKLSEKNFKLNENIEDVTLEERELEFLYVEGKNYLFLDINSLEQVLVPNSIVGDRADFLKEGIEAKGSFYGDLVFGVELPQFLELMVSETEGDEEVSPLSHATKLAVLETGAKIEVPPFIESGDIIKVDTQSKEYVQRL